MEGHLDGVMQHSGETDRAARGTWTVTYYLCRAAAGLLTRNLLAEASAASPYTVRLHIKGTEPLLAA